MEDLNLSENERDDEKNEMSKLSDRDIWWEEWQNFLWNRPEYEQCFKWSEPQSQLWVSWTEGESI